MAKRFKGVPNLPFAPIAAVMLGLAFAILAFNTPDWRLERLVGASGLASILPAAKPPLGNTARTLLSVARVLTHGCSTTTRAMASSSDRRWGRSPGFRPVVG